MINYSIIIPHKNTQDLLERCLDIIPLRSDCEIIIIDDNGSSTIVDFTNFPGLKRKDTTVIFSKECKGAGFCRNIGVSRSKGKWLIFADADDYFSDKISTVLDKYANDEKHGAIFLNACIVDENSLIHPFIQNRLIENYLHNKKYSEDILKYQVWTPWSRMTKRDIIINNNILFEETKIANDAFFILNATSHIKTMDAVKDIIYFYYKPSQGSLTDKFYDNSIPLFRLELKLRVNRFYKVQGYPYHWPIQREIHLLGVKRNQEVNALLRKYDYDIIDDIIYTVKYFYSKLIKRL